jgi:hypothetical protein
VSVWDILLYRIVDPLLDLYYRLTLCPLRGHYYVTISDIYPCNIQPSICMYCGKDQS